jgi:hypothetical protein
MSTLNLSIIAGLARVHRVTPSCEMGRETCQVLDKRTELRGDRVTKALMPQFRKQLRLRGDTRNEGSRRDGSGTSNKVQVVAFLQVDECGITCVGTLKENPTTSWEMNQVISIEETV